MKIIKQKFFLEKSGENERSLKSHRRYRTYEKMSFILYDSDDPDGGSIFLDPPKTEIDNEIESGVNRKRFL